MISNLMSGSAYQNPGERQRSMASYSSTPAIVYKPALIKLILSGNSDYLPDDFAYTENTDHAR